MLNFFGMSYQPHLNRTHTGTHGKKEAAQKVEKKARTEVTSVIRVESNVSGGGAGWGGAFSSMVEVWDGGWRAVRAVMVGGCPLRSLLKPILSVAAGGGGESRRPVEETEGKINGAAGDHPLARHDAHSHTALVAFSCSLYLSLTHSFPFISTLRPTVCLSFC